MRSMIHSSSILRIPRLPSRTSNHPSLNLNSIRRQSAWAAAVDSAKNLLNDSHPPPSSASASASGTKGKGKDQSSGSSTLKSLFPKAASFLPSPKPKPKPIIRDPLSLVSSELSSLRSNVTSLLGSGHPSLDTIAKYYFQAEGKHVRPLIVLLMAKATNGLSQDWNQLQNRFLNREFSERKESGKSVELDCGIDEPLSPREVLNDFNPHMESIEGSLPSSNQSTSTSSPNTISQQTSSSTTTTLDPLFQSHTIGSYPILPTQRRLAEITEMIHVASLLHDDVIDASELRRSFPSAPSAFGNKLSILGGDFLLGRASVALARLRNNEVVELLATVIANLVEGEVMQLKSQSNDKSSKSIFSNFWNLGGSSQKEEKNSNTNPLMENQDESDKVDGGLDIKRSNSPFAPTPELFENYLQKTYLKTAALIGKSARASVILGGNGSNEEASSSLGNGDDEFSKKIRDSAYSYGRNLGIAFQLVDDLLDFKSTSLAFGKPSGGADLRLGLATAPVLYAWEEMEEKGMKEMKEMVERKFEGKGDVEKVLKIVNESNGLERTANLARYHAQLATDALQILPESEARDALVQLTEQVLTRAK